MNGAERKCEHNVVVVPTVMMAAAGPSRRRGCSNGSKWVRDGLTALGRMFHVSMKGCLVEVVCIVKVENEVGKILVWCFGEYKIIGLRFWTDPTLPFCTPWFIFTPPFISLFYFGLFTSFYCMHSPKPPNVIIPNPQCNNPQPNAYFVPCLLVLLPILAFSINTYFTSLILFVNWFTSCTMLFLMYTPFLRV